MPLAPPPALPGRSMLARVPTAYAHLTRSLRIAWKRMTCRVPAAVFHVTHYKAGSQWVHRILHALAEPWVVPPEVGNGQFLGRPLRPAAVYPTVYVTRAQFEAAALPRDWRRFVVIRDLRDTLVSAFFSLKVSHNLATEEMAGFRGRLQGLTTEQALGRMVREWCPAIAAIQRSWADGPDPVLKYEDLLVRDVEILEPLLLGHCRLPATPEHLRAVVLANRFEAKAGRKRGEEDVRSHQRKGVAGDWRNHFTDKVAKLFNDRFGDLLVTTGYESDHRW